MEDVTEVQVLETAYGCLLQGGWAQHEFGSIRFCDTDRHCAVGAVDVALYQAFGVNPRITFGQCPRVVSIRTRVLDRIVGSFRTRQDVSATMNSEYAIIHINDSPRTTFKQVENAFKRAIKRAQRDAK